MEKIFYNNDGWVCQRYPHNIPIENEEQFIEVDAEIASKTRQSSKGLAWRIVNGTLIEDIYNQQDYSDVQLNMLRNKRSLLLNAFDIYKTNIFFGIEVDSEHDIILNWYQKILDLDENSINNPPDVITKYL